MDDTEVSLRQVALPISEFSETELARRAARLRRRRALTRTCASALLVLSMVAVVFVAPKLTSDDSEINLSTGQSVPGAPPPSDVVNSTPASWQLLTSPLPPTARLVGDTPTHLVAASDDATVLVPIEAGPTIPLPEVVGAVVAASHGELELSVATVDPDGSLLTVVTYGTASVSTFEIPVLGQVRAVFSGESLFYLSGTTLYQVDRFTGSQRAASAFPVQVEGPTPQALVALGADDVLVVIADDAFMRLDGTARYHLSRWQSTSQTWEDISPPLGLGGAGIDVVARPGGFSFVANLPSEDGRFRSWIYDYSVGEGSWHEPSPIGSEPHGTCRTVAVGGPGAGLASACKETMVVVGGGSWGPTIGAPGIDSATVMGDGVIVASADGQAYRYVP